VRQARSLWFRRSTEEDAFGKSIERVRPKNDAVEPGLVDVNGLALVVIIWVGGWVVQQPTHWRHLFAPNELLQ
jgi:hypothetical protein